MTLRISILVSDLSTRGAGRWGGAVRPFLLARALQQLHYQVKLVGFTFGDDVGVASTPDLPVEWVPAAPYPAFVQSVARVRAGLEGDLIYAYKPKPSSFGVGLLDRLQTGRSLLLDIDDWELSWYGGDDWQYRPSFKQFGRDVLKPDGALRQPDHPLYLRWMESFISRADAITTHTRFLQHRFGGVRVPNGKDTELFNPDRYNRVLAREKYGLADYGVLMFPGAPRPYKGVEDVLMALAQLGDRRLRLVIVGGSPYDNYDRQLQEQWGEWMISLPKVPSAAMPELIAAADLIVVPQRDTPAAQAQFPLKLTDGMAMAKPVLATSVGDIPDILGGTGYVVAPHSPDELAAQIRYILHHNEEATEKGRQARQRCVQYYSLEAMAQSLAGVMGQFAS